MCEIRSQQVFLVDKRRKLNFLYTFNLRPVSTWLSSFSKKYNLAVRKATKKKKKIYKNMGQQEENFRLPWKFIRLNNKIVQVGRFADILAADDSVIIIQCTVNDVFR